MIKHFNVLCIIFSVADAYSLSTPGLPFVLSSLSRHRRGEPSTTLYRDKVAQTTAATAAATTTTKTRRVDLFAYRPSLPELPYSCSSGKKDNNRKSTTTDLSAATLGLELTNSVSHDFCSGGISGRSKKCDFQIFCDLDGVLVDFEAGVQNIMNRPTKQLPKHIMWKGIRRADNFFENLPWTKGGRKLWREIRHLSPDILTGVPDHEASKVEKFNWCRRELGLKRFHHVDMAGHQYRHLSVNGKIRKEGVCNVITCWSDNKHYESHPRAVLIDDRIAAKEMWEASGGIFVHHTDVASTLRQLKEHSII